MIPCASLAMFDGIKPICLTDKYMRNVRYKKISFFQTEPINTQFWSGENKNSLKTKCCVVPLFKVSLQKIDTYIQSGKKIKQSGREGRGRWGT